MLSKAVMHSSYSPNYVYEGSGNDWQAYIDGDPVEHIRVNYLLRGLYCACR